jgi:two-component system response regulator HydG
MPALRERPDDIELLANHFITRISRDMGRPPAKLTPEALRVLQGYAWPGNVRELRNTIERVLLLEADEQIRLEHLPSEIAGGSGAVAAEGLNPFPRGVVRPWVEIERMAIHHALGVCEGNKTRAAQMLGISRQTLRSKLKEFQIDDDGEGDES